MMRRIAVGAVMMMWLACGFGWAQPAVGFPQHVLIASDSFIDIGPPFDYYEITAINTSALGVHVERVRVAAAMDACLARPTLEWQQEDLPITMTQLLEGKNPCGIPEIDLKKELNRCKKCLTFSGINVSMQLSCGAADRTIHMNVLDRDLFDPKSGTPRNASWTMGLLSRLNDTFGSAAWDKPIFDHQSQVPVSQETREERIVQEVKGGKYDHFFPTGTIDPDEISKLAQQAELPLPQPSIKLAKSEPSSPLKVEMPKYPPIARAAHVEGDVMITFDVTKEGTTENFVFGPDKLLMLHGALAEAVSHWQFTPSVERYQEQVTVSFSLGCGKTADSK